MNLLKRNPIFCTFLFLLLGLASGGLWYLSRLDSELQQLRVQYETKLGQYKRYVVAKPSPTKTNLQAIENNHKELYQVFQDTLRTLNLNTYDRDGLFGAMPVSRADWSFEVHKYIEEARYSAMSKGIKVPDDSAFGIQRYTRATPSEDEAERVHRQIVIMGHVLDSLFDSGIKRFVSIERGIPVPSNETPKGRTTRRQVERPFIGAEEFEVDPAMTMAVPGVMKAYSFRLAFEGQSIALRSFLNRIVNSPMPYAIRDLEVRLASEAGAKRKLESIADNPFEAGDSVDSLSSVPIISDNSSRFIVSLEFLDLEQVIEKPEVTASDERRPSDV